MFWLFLSISVLIPLAMLFVTSKFPKIEWWFTLVAFISLLMSGSFISSTVYQVIARHEVFMTTIHKILLVPSFLFSGAYIGLYLLYQLALRLKNGYRG